MALADNLVAYYSMEGNTTDSVNGYNGTDTSVTYSSTGGKVSQYFSVSGTGYANVTNTANLRPTGSYSVNFWMLSTSTSPDSFFNSSNLTGGSFYGIGFRMSGAGANKLTWNHMHTTGDSGDLTSATTVNTGSWVMVTCVYDTGANLRTMYINGTSDATIAETNDATYNATNYIYIGARYLDGVGSVDTKLNGRIDELAIWNGKVLTSGEVTTLYNGGAGLAYADIVGGGGGSPTSPLMMMGIGS